MKNLCKLFLSVYITAVLILLLFTFSHTELGGGMAMPDRSPKIGMYYNSLL